MKQIAIFTSFFKIEQNMSGMGYRAWEFAQVLAKYHKVILVIPRETDFKETSNISFVVASEQVIDTIINKADVILTLPEVSKDILIKASIANKIIISDITYNPIEALEKDAIKLSKERDIEYKAVLDQYKLHLLVSDLIIVESHEQELFMLGALMSLGRIEFSNYKRSIDFSHLITKIPVGFNRFSLKRVATQREETDHSTKVLLWNGGIWNHYDPTPIVKAMQQVIKRSPDVKLLFMYCSSTKMTTDAKNAIKLSKKLGLYETSIIFNKDIITYKERDKLFLHSRAIVCANPYAIDAMIMRRLRFRDSLLYELPMMTSKGGSLPDIIEKMDIGITFDNNDIKSITGHILKLVEDEKYYSQLRANIKKAQSIFLLENNIDNLLRFIEVGKKAPDTSYLRLKKNINILL